MNGTNFLVLADWDDNILLTLSLVVGDLLILRKSFSWTEDRTKCSKLWWMCWVSTWNLQAKILMQCLHRVQILLTMMQFFIDWNCRNGLQRRFFHCKQYFLVLTACEQQDPGTIAAFLSLHDEIYFWQMYISSCYVQDIWISSRSHQVGTWTSIMAWQHVADDWMFESFWQDSR